MDSRSLSGETRKCTIRQDDRSLNRFDERTARLRLDRLTCPAVQALIALRRVARRSNPRGELTERRHVSPGASSELCDAQVWLVEGRRLLLLKGQFRLLLHS